MPNPIKGPVGRLAAAAQNAIEVARFGGFDTGDQGAPYEVATRTDIYRLRRYYHDDPLPEGSPAVILVPPLMMSAEVWDVSHATSAVRILHEHGITPWVVDFGAPEHEEGGLRRTLTDHVLAVADAVDQVRDATGSDVHIGGYSQGGMFCYQAAAYRRSAGVASIIVFGSPVSTLGTARFGLPEELVVGAAKFLGEHVLGSSGVPGWASRMGFRMLDPVKSVRQRVDFILQLHDREALLPRERQRRFLAGEGFVAYPGPALADLIQQFIVHNRMLSGGFVVGDRLITLADIRVPILMFVGTVDDIAPPPAVRAITRAAPRAEVYEVPIRTGHFGLVVGSTASKICWPTTAEWIRWRAGEGPRPANVENAAEPDLDGSEFTASRALFGLELGAGVGLGLARSVAVGTVRAAETAVELGLAAASQLPRLIRLERVQPNTRISLALLLDEQASRDPGEIFFLYEDRAYTRDQVKARIDAVVRGLVSVGIRQGEHVGVLMHARPSGVTIAAALNRLGAVAVLMRPDGDPVREAALGEVTRVIADPELAERALEAGVAQVLVLGGGSEPRDLGRKVVDMERIDPDAVRLPRWYHPNPGRARDLAFVMFSGEGARTRAKHVTNGRAVLSAFGTATSAALTASDTIYSVTPIYHPSGLLMSLGGAIAGGSRLALAREFHPATFWEEVRRYGATVASYTWTLLHDVVEAPPDPGERHHPIRLFIGSGMPSGLWRRVTERFRPEGVIEFYASTEGDAVLVNLTGLKPACKGRPLPGSAEVRVVKYDAEAGHVIEGADGYARGCAPGEAGMLVSRTRAEFAGTAGNLLRGVFERDDAWLATGDLFSVDEDGDFWFVDHAPALVPTAGGLVPAMPAQDALGELEAVDLAAVYGVPGANGLDVLVAAVTLRPGRKLDPADLHAALEGVRPEHRPAIVHVVKEMPVTTWFRPATGVLRSKGVPRASAKAWYRDGAGYRRLDAAAREELTGKPRPAARVRAKA